MFPFNALLVVFCLLQLEDVVDEELLEILVAEVDAQLLKTVLVERLETKDVQDTNGQPLVSLVLLWYHGGPNVVGVVWFGIVRYGLVHLWFVDGSVDLLDDPDELSSVETLDKCIAHISSCLGTALEIVR